MEAHELDSIEEIDASSFDTANGVRSKPSHITPGWHATQLLRAGHKFSVNVDPLLGPEWSNSVGKSQWLRVMPEKIIPDTTAAFTVALELPHLVEIQMSGRTVLSFRAIDIGASDSMKLVVGALEHLAKF